MSRIAEATPLIRHVDLNDRVYETVRERLVTRKLGPGEKLSLHTLADELGVSRSPVHHALTRLVAEGLVSVRPRRGYFVTPMTAQGVEDAYDVRLGLELVAAERTVGTVAAEQLAELGRLAGEAAAAEDGHDWHVANRAFHECQVDLADNPLMAELYRRVTVNLLMVMESVIAGRPATWRGAVDADHGELVAAFEAGDLERARATIRRHVDVGRRLAGEAIESAGGAL